MDKANGTSSTLQATIKQNMQKRTDHEETEKHICTAVNENEGHDRIMDGAFGVVAEKDIIERRR